MKKTTYGFTVETDTSHHDKTPIIRISMDDGSDGHEVVITPHEVDLLIQQLQEAKAELTQPKPKASSNHHQTRN